MGNNKTISVIIPTYNRKDMLMQTLENIRLQTYVDFEIIVVDDCSSDGTEEIMKTLNMSNFYYYRNEENSGPGYSRKFGYARSNGRYIVFIDDDDYYTDYSFFEKAMSVFGEYEAKGKPLSLVCANSSLMYRGTGKISSQKLAFEGEVNHYEYLEGLRAKYIKPPIFATVFSKKALDESGISNVKSVDDTIIYLRALLHSNLYILPDDIGIYWVHGSNISFTLNVDFIMGNLEEIRKVYDILKGRNVFHDCDAWLYTQAIRTIYYFIATNSMVGAEEIAKLHDWAARNNCLYAARTETGEEQRVKEFLRNGELLCSMEKFSELVELCKEFVLRTQDDRVFSMLASAQFALGDIPSAEISAKTGLFHNPNSPDNLYNLACILQSKGDFSNALHYFAQAERVGDEELSAICRENIKQLNHILA